MICPQCRSEYRAGFTRCAECKIDLVEEGTLAEPEKASSTHVDPATRMRMDASLEAELFPFCGFLGVEDARAARDSLREAGIPADILIREAVGPDGEVEEFWIRVPRRRFAEVADVLHEEPVDEPKGGNGEVSGAAEEEEEPFACSECGEDVPGDADVCPNCGARFAE